ncbi:MAG: MFS transporter [Congregibacter sp.]
MADAPGNTQSPAQDQASFYGWKLVAAVFVIYLINTAFPYYGGSVLNAAMAKELDFSRSALGYGFSAFIVLMGVSSPLVGILVNRIGVRLTLFMGSMIIVGGALGMALIASNEFQYLLFFGAVCGLGFSLGGVIPAQSVVTYWFKRRKPLAMSIVLCASGVGSIISIPILNRVVSAFDNDWRIGWYVVAAMAGISALTALLFVRNKPADLGQLPDGDSAEVATAAAQAPQQANAKPAVYVTGDVWTTGEVFKTSMIWLVVFAACAYTMVFNFCIAHGVVHLRDQQIDGELTATSVGLLVMSSIIGRLGCGTIGARIEPRLIWCFGLLCSAVGVLILMFATSSWQVYTYALITGIGFGASYVSMANLLGNYFGPECFAPLLGIVVTVTCLVGALSPALGGMIYDATGNYQLAFYGLAAIAAVGVVSVPFATPPQRDADH